MSFCRDCHRTITRRNFFGLATAGLGSAALAYLLSPELFASDAPAVATRIGGLPGLPHFAPTAKRVIYMHMLGAPSQLDLFDCKPGLLKLQGTDLPDSVRMGQRITGLTANQKQLPITPSLFHFRQHGQCGGWLSELLPHTAKVVDDIAIVKSMHTDAINHDPGVTFMQTGSQRPGRPSMGAWITYGLGSENASLPAFVVMVSNNPVKIDQPLYSRLWGSGFLPSNYQGVQFRADGDPVLYLSDPPGVPRTSSREMLDTVDQLNRIHTRSFADPEIETRIAQYETAFRMQMSVPELMDISKEPDSIFELYGPDSRKPGTYAASCLLARRLAERNVRFIQIYHRGWDHHQDLPKDLAGSCQRTDQPTAALVQDLKQRGLLKDTLVVWGGEFGRTVYAQGKVTKGNYGRDHHGRCFAMWLAGGGIKGGLTLGESDDYGYNIVSDPVSVNDLHATILHCLGVDHTRLTYKYLGREFRLTDVSGEVVKKLLA